MDSKFRFRARQGVRFREFRLCASESGANLIPVRSTSSRAESWTISMALQCSGDESQRWLDAEKILQRRIDLVRLLLWDKVAAIDAVAAHVAGMVAPHPKEVIAAPLPAVGSPQHQHRHPD